MVSRQRRDHLCVRADRRALWRHRRISRRAHAEDNPSQKSRRRAKTPRRFDLVRREGAIMLSSEKTMSAGIAGPMLDLEKVRSSALNTHPFDHLIVSDFIRPEWQNRLIADFSHLIDAMEGPEFRRVVEEKFSLSLEARPTMFTVRGYCRRTDGKIHTDTESKIITVLLYMNPRWANPGGQLRLLNSATDIEDVAAEISPTVGTLLIFRRCDHSFHGHLPFEGERKAIQMNWVTEQTFVDREAKRHRWSALIKRLRFS